MEYYKLLQLEREPFSNSPDPEYFFNSRQHMGCLQKLELALRLKRGLNVVIGDVGTGKTTLCRQLIRNFSTEPDVETHLILDPSFDSATEILKRIGQMICYHEESHTTLSDTEMKELIKQTLFKKGVDEAKTVILIIDEGQKISDPCLEILRELLNYETNTYKLLQIVIFAQLEFNEILKTHANFADRINLLHHLAPLRFADTRQLIQHRLKLSSTTARPITLFTLPALWAIYRASRGYPRKIIHLCHQSILALIIQNRTKAGWGLIQSCKKRLGARVPTRRNLIWAAALTLMAAFVLTTVAPVFKSNLSPPSPIASFKIQKDESPAALSTSNPPTEATPQTAFTAEAPAATIPLEVKKPPSQETKEAVDTVDSIQETSIPATAQNTITEPIRQPPPAPRHALPKDLGRLMVQPGDTLSAMTRQVYGRRNNRFLRSVITANPHIADPNDIDIGHWILFPSTVVNVTPPQPTGLLVQLDSPPSLNAAVQKMRTLNKTYQLATQMVVTWTPFQGLRFQIIDRPVFSNQAAAQARIDTLPQAVASQTAVVPSWPAETVFYTDPFQKTDISKPLFKVRDNIEE